MTEKPDNGDTFMIAVADLKAIVDREFDEVDNRKENTYGQTVTLTYNATLNDKAAEKQVVRDLKMMSVLSFPMTLIPQEKEKLDIHHGILLYASHTD